MNLYLVRGLPGSGKSTFAAKLSRGLQCPWFEADQFLYVDGVYTWTANTCYRGHLTCVASVKECMEGKSDNIVVSNVFRNRRAMKNYLAMAKEFGYTVTTLVVENRHGGVNVHDVPDETLANMRENFEVIL